MVYPSPGTNGDESATGHNTDAVSKGIGLLHGVGGEDDRATLLYALYHIPHVLARHGIHTGRRFVQKDHRGSPDGRDRNAQPPSHAAAEFPRMLIGYVGKLNALEEISDFGGRGGSPAAFEEEREERGRRLVQCS